MYRSINQHDLLSDEKYNNFLNKYEIEILDICQKISSQRFIKNIDNSLIDNTTFDEFHPIFKKHYIPHRTSANGNCLFNMISLCLCGNESLTKILRACTVYTIIKFLYQFTEVIKREEQIHNVDNNVNTLNDIIIKKLN